MYAYTTGVIFPRSFCNGGGGRRRGWFSFGNIVQRVPRITWAPRIRWFLHVNTICRAFRANLEGVWPFLFPPYIFNIFFCYSATKSFQFFLDNFSFGFYSDITNYVVPEHYFWVKAIAIPQVKRWLVFYFTNTRIFVFKRFRIKSKQNAVFWLR